MLDLGAGSGVLTAALLAAGARVVAVELDAALVHSLRRRFAGEPVEVLSADARRLCLPAEPFSVVSNLPFAGATGILRALLDDPRAPLGQVDAVLQWEAALKRAAVWPGTLLGSYWGAWWELGVVRRLPPSAFAPPPSVPGGVLRAVRRAEPLLDPAERGAFRRLLAQAYEARAPLRRSLAGVVGARTLKRLAAAHGFPPGALPRDLDARQWAALYHAVRTPG